MRARLTKKLTRRARTVALEAAEVARSIAAVQEAAATMEKAASVVALTWPDVERRSKPRLPSFHKHVARVEWKHVALYVPLLVLVVLLGAYALWSFFERQSLVVDPIPLPKVTVVTASPSSHLAASWVRLLTDAELQPTLVTADKVEALEGVIVLCDIWSLPPAFSARLDRFLNGGGAVVVIGPPPATPIAGLHLTADAGLSDNAVKFSETSSPLLARQLPGDVVSLRPANVAFLKETPRMAVDARWRTNARAAVMHMENGRTRCVWIGVDADALPPGGSNSFTLLVRTAFRWAGGEAISDGAVGAATETKMFSPDSRRSARGARFAFSVDRLQSHDAFGVRMVNRGPAPLENPTVKVWLPPNVREAKLAGDLVMRHNASVAAIPDQRACLVALPSLARNEERVLKLSAR
ncbi:MAG TPA: hypothetical protein VG323_14125 [Thermoanaerobaculia bacterium]|nr:hypothetical protein [Thermoanaerobaculia bacterium]